jgi:ATP-dependent helicase HrpB
VLSLPIDEILPTVAERVRGRRRLVLTAPPGSGKSTRVPPLLCEVVAGQVLLLQPRRVAARSLATRIAAERGWKLGGEVGYKVRFERVGSDATRLWVMTEGTLTRRLQEDPYLEGVGAVVLDEFHERSLHTDLALAWLAELQRTVREDLAVVVMSATMDAAPVARFLADAHDDAPALDAPGRPHPVAVRHWQQLSDRHVSERVAAAVDEALAAPDSGDVLVFLPGVGEIRACQAALDGRVDAEVLPLHGQLPPDEQDRALRSGERRRVILSTNVAETSLTIPGVRTVIDSGLARVNRFNPDTGLDELVLEGISRASADQRAGRAGRTAPGRCWRLWSPTEDQRRPAATDPEIARVDLAPVALLLKSWQGEDPRRFPWFQPPEAVRLQAAEELLAMLGASAAPFGALQPLGQRLARLPAHPRLGRLILDAVAAGAPRLGCALAALVGERDLRLPRPGPRRDAPLADPSPVDALDRLEALAEAERRGFRAELRHQGIDPGAAREAARVRDELQRALPGDERRHAGESVAPDIDLIIRLLLAAYPDRVGKRAVADGNRGMLVGGVAVEIDRASGLATKPGTPRPELFLAYAVQGLAGRAALGQGTLVRQGAELDEALLASVHPGSIQRREQLAWNEQRQQVDALIGWFYRDLCIRIAKDGAQPDAAAVAELLAAKLAPQAQRLIAEDEEAAGWLQRYRWLRLARPDLELPAIGDQELHALVAELCAGCRSRAEVAARPKQPWLASRLGYHQAQQVDEFAPSHLAVPSGSRIRLDYADADAERPPVLAVRLQELFGLPETPRLGGGRVPVLLHLLAPNYRVEQVTRDLASFWANTYVQVRKDLRSRYPKHSWPDDPLTAPPVAKGRPRP